MIALYTDFGLAGPYIGQMELVLLDSAPGVPVINLFADAPTHNVLANAYLLWSYTSQLPEASVILAVVDPGVGSTERRPVVVKADGRWYVGPGNGLFDVLARRASQFEQWEIVWRPDDLSASFHGRDLFAPVAARLAKGEQVALAPLAIDTARIAALPEELAEIVYVDHFGNLITGIRAQSLGESDGLILGGKSIKRARIFADVPVSQPLCYENSNGLLEIAVNQGRADEYFQARVGDSVSVVSR